MSLRGHLDRTYLQFSLTVALLFFLPSNLLKLFGLIILWLVLFWPISKKEFIAFIVINLIFVVNNIMAIENGVFRFLQPDLGHLPYYEFVMWGFYLIHSHRVTKPKWPNKWNKGPLVFSLLFTLCFGLAPDQNILLISSLIVLMAACVLFKNKSALTLGLYMLIMGALIEYTGVYFHMWEYPKPYPGGVAYWFAPMWFGVGYFYYFCLGPYLKND